MSEDNGFTHRLKITERVHFLMSWYKEVVKYNRSQLKQSVLERSLFSKIHACDLSFASACDSYLSIENGVNF